MNHKTLSTPLLTLIKAKSQIHALILSTCNLSLWPWTWHELPQNPWVINFVFVEFPVGCCWGHLAIIIRLTRNGPATTLALVRAMPQVTQTKRSTPGVPSSEHHDQYSVTNTKWMRRHQIPSSADRFPLVYCSQFCCDFEWEDDPRLGKNHEME